MYVLCKNSSIFTDLTSSVNVFFNSCSMHFFILSWGFFLMCAFPSSSFSSSSYYYYNLPISSCIRHLTSSLYLYIYPFPICLSLTISTFILCGQRQVYCSFSDILNSHFIQQNACTCTFHILYCVLYAFT